MKRLFFLVMSVLLPTMVLATASSCKSKTSETDKVNSDMQNIATSNADVEIDVRVVVSITDKGMKVFKSPSKTALKLTLVAAGSSMIEFSWTKDGKREDYSEEFTVREALVTDEQDAWYQVSVEGITGYVSKAECKLATLIPATDDLLKQWYQNECYQQNVDGISYVLKWGVYNPAGSEALQICKVKDGKVLVVDIGYMIEGGTITFYTSREEVTFTNPRYCKETPDNLTPADFKKLLAAMAMDTWENEAATWLKIDGKKDWFIISPEPNGYVEDNF